jgi:DNA-binding transcriptional LysR family regulator
MRDLQFADLHLFARVAELGTLSAVARERDVPVSQVSRTLARIEKSCSARLIHRSTHGLALTAEGDTFLGYCRRMLGTLDELEGEFADQARQAGGTVRVAASPVIAQYLLIPGFEDLSRRHPRLRIDLLVEDRLVDMARDGVDIAIRTGTPPSDTVVARRIGSLGRRIYAAPAYLEQFGTPAHPDDLRAHRLITNSAVTMLNRWCFIVKGKPVVLAAEGYWRSDNTSTTAQLALQGLGIARLATLVGEPLARRGLLRPVLADCLDDQPTPVNAITLTSRHRLPKIKACIDYWAATFGRTEAPPVP